MAFTDDDDYTEEDVLDQFDLPEDLKEKRIVLQILDAGGNIEDIIFEIDEIYKYVVNVYKNCPERN